MRKVDISEYGRRHGAFRTFTAGESSSHFLHIPKKPSFKHSFVKMLWLIWKNPLKTRKEIIEFAFNPLCASVLSFGPGRTAPMNPDINDYWAELHRYGYIEQVQFRAGQAVRYRLTDMGENSLKQIPEEEKKVLGIQ